MTFSLLFDKVNSLKCNSIYVHFHVHFQGVLPEYQSINQSEKLMLFKKLLSLWKNKSLSPKWYSGSQSVQSLSRVRLFATPWTAAHQASLSITSSQSPPKPMSINSSWWCCPIIYHPLSSPSPPALNLSQH